VGVVNPKSAVPRFALPYPAYEQIRDHNQVFSSVLAYADTDLTARFGDTSDRVHAQMISGSFFKTLGVDTIFGRPILPDDDRPGAAPLVVISSHFWRQHLAGASDIVGRSLLLNGVPFTIAGVVTPRFSGVELGFSPDVYVPISLQPRLNPGSRQLQASTTWWLHILGRLRFGVFPEQARANLGPVFAGFLRTAVREYPPDIPQAMKDEFLRQQVIVSDGSAGISRLRKQFREPLLVLMGAALLVLFVTCLNLANMLLARGVARHREMAIRLTLGAERSRLIHQLLTESVLLAVIGGAIGLLMSSVVEHFLAVRLLYPASLQLGGSVRVILFTAAIALLGGCLFGLLPAIQVSRRDPAGALKDDPQDLHGRRRKFSLSSALVTAQIVVSLGLLSCAALFARTLQKLDSVDRGFTHSAVMLFSVNPAASGYTGSRVFDFYESLKQGLSALPGVEKVSFSFSSPLSGNDSTTMISPFGSDPAVHATSHAHRNMVSPDYFGTTGIPLLAGRDFDSRDNGNTPKVAIVNESFTKDIFGSESPIGKRLGYGPSQNSGPVEIVGVAADSKYDSLREQHVPMIYLPYRQFSPQAMTFELRVSGISNSLLPAIRHLAGSTVPITDVTTLAEQVGQSLIQERLLTLLTSCFAALTLLLAGLGLFGLINYRVATRTREIGLRMALGAQRTNVLGLVLKGSLLPVGVGAAIGLPCAFGAGRIIQGLLFGVMPGDPTTMSIATALLVLTAACAAFLPVRRALRLEPMSALKRE
jgi:predicted permease